jgi:hypothetical protein
LRRKDVDVLHNPKHLEPVFNPQFVSYQGQLTAQIARSAKDVDYIDVVARTTKKLKAQCNAGLKGTSTTSREVAPQLIRAGTLANATRAAATTEPASFFYSTAAVEAFAAASDKMPAHLYVQD